MLTIKTKPDCTLGFLPYPEGGTAGLLVKHEGIIMKREIIGKLSEITEEQARELVEESGLDRGGFKNPSFRQQKCFSMLAKDALEFWALSVGIEEKSFDKYLVVKL